MRIPALAALILMSSATAVLPAHAQPSLSRAVDGIDQKIRRKVSVNCPSA